MNSDIFFDCPNCGGKIRVNILSCKEGTEILCPKCKKLIKLHFEGDTPKQILDKVERNLKKELKKISKNIKLRL